MLHYVNTHRATLTLPEALSTALRQEAARRGVTVSALTREGIAAHLGLHGESGPHRRRLASEGAGDSGRTVVSERTEELLREDIGRDA